MSINARLDEHEARLDAHDIALGRLLAEVLSEVSLLRREMRDDREDRKRLLRPPLTSLDYEVLSDTALRRNVEELEAANATLAAKNAGLEATIKERERASLRAEAIEDKRWSKKQKIGAGILALLTASGGGAWIWELIKSLAER